MKRLREMLSSDDESASLTRDQRPREGKDHKAEEARTDASVGGLGSHEAPRLPLTSWTTCLASYFNACMECQNICPVPVEVMTNCSGTDSPILGLEACSIVEEMR